MATTAHQNIEILIYRAVLIKATDTPFQWITTSAEAATDFTLHMEKQGYTIHTNTDMVWFEKVPTIQEAYSLGMLDKIRHVLHNHVCNLQILES
jgi:hypothetical protein